MKPLINKSKIKTNFTLSFLITICFLILILEILLRIDLLISYNVYSSNLFLLFEILNNFYRYFTNPLFPSVLIVCGIIICFVSLRNIQQFYIGNLSNSSLLNNEKKERFPNNINYQILYLIIALVSIFFSLVVFQSVISSFFGYSSDSFIFLKLEYRTSHTQKWEFHLDIENTILFTIFLIAILSLISKIICIIFSKLKNIKFNFFNIFYSALIMVNVFLSLYFVYNTYAIVFTADEPSFKFTNPALDIFAYIFLISFISIHVPILIFALRNNKVITNIKSLYNSSESKSLVYSNLIYTTLISTGVIFIASIITFLEGILFNNDIRDLRIDFLYRPLGYLRRLENYLPILLIIVITLVIIGFFTEKTNEIKNEKNPIKYKEILLYSSVISFISFFSTIIIFSLFLSNPFDPNSSKILFLDDNYFRLYNMNYLILIIFSISTVIITILASKVLSFFIQKKNNMKLNYSRVIFIAQIIMILELTVFLIINIYFFHFLITYNSGPFGYIPHIIFQNIEISIYNSILVFSFCNLLFILYFLLIEELNNFLKKKKEEKKFSNLLEKIEALKN